MTRYELHYKGEKQDPKQFKSEVEALKYIKRLREVLFDNRNANPQAYLRRLKFVNDLTIVEVKFNSKFKVFSVLENIKNTCSVVRNFDTIEKAKKYCNISDNYFIMETMLNES